MISDKDKINYIAGTASLSILVVLLTEYILELDVLNEIPNEILFYLLVPLSLIWFGTRKNGCGSCNQIHSISKEKSQTKQKNQK